MKFKYTKKYENVSQVVGGPYNDPCREPNYDPEVFEVEYENVRNGLKLVISEYLMGHELSGDGVDVGHLTGPSRGIGLVVDEICSGTVIDLIRDIHLYLKVLPVDYCVPINLVLRGGGGFKDLYICITKGEELLVHAERRVWFKEVGIDC